MADLNQTPSANRVHIAFFGKRNAGKSSVVNAVTGQNISIVSDVKGTTTDPVQKAMELLPLGPVVIIDTPGMDDEGTVGELRVQRARQVLNKADIAVLVIDGTVGKSAEDFALQKLIEKKGVPYIIVLNKADLGGFKAENDNEIAVSAKTGEHIFELKEKLAAIAAKGQNTKVILGDLLERGDHVVLVTPIDSSAPKGRHDFAAGAGHPRHSGRGRNMLCHAGGRACGRAKRPQNAAEVRCYGQSGIRQSKADCAREH